MRRRRRVERHAGVYGTSTGVDGQLFNIAVQGVATVMNGYCDYKGEGLREQRRAASGAMFDDPGGTRPTARIRCRCSIATSPWGDLRRPRMHAPAARSGIGQNAQRSDRRYTEINNPNTHPTAPKSRVERLEALKERHFYTFHYAPFSSRQMHLEGLSELEIEQALWRCECPYEENEAEGSGPARRASQYRGAHGEHLPGSRGQPISL